MTRTASARSARLDQVCADAVEVARAGITEADPEAVGEHLSAVAEGDRLVTHSFECRLAGYQGWRWAVTVTRVPRSRHVTICDTVLLPGPDSLLAPGWLPWQDRLQPGDLGVGDLLPTAPDDSRLAPGYLLSDDPAVEEVSSTEPQSSSRASAVRLCRSARHVPGVATIAVRSPAFRRFAEPTARLSQHRWAQRRFRR